MSTTQRETIHPRDGALVRYLDGELLPAEGDPVDEHVSRCLECRERLDELGEWGAVVSEYVALTEAGIEVDELARGRAVLAARERANRVPAGGTRRASSGYLLRAAVAAGVLVLGGLTVQPVRAWIAERIGLRSEEVVAPPAPALPPAAGSATPAAGSIVSFRPSERLFVFELVQAQVGGAVHLEAVDSEQASAQILDGAAATMLVLPAGVRVENEAGSESSYRLRLPVDVVERARIVIAGELARELVLGVAGAPAVVVDLSGSDGER